MVPSIPDTLSVMFYVDDVAQEPNETLTLTLDPRSPIPTGNGVFFQSTSELTIIDSDSKSFITHTQIFTYGFY